jgi:hypothetical protein
MKSSSIPKEAGTALDALCRDALVSCGAVAQALLDLMRPSELRRQAQSLRVRIPKRPTLGYGCEPRPRHLYEQLFHGWCRPADAGGRAGAEPFLAGC